MNIKKEIWVLAWPVMLVATLNTLFSIVGLKFIALLGTEQTAGAGLASSIIEVILVLGVLISTGTIAIASRSVGSANLEEFETVCKQSILYSVLFGITTFVLALIFKNQLIAIFGVTADVYVHTVAYIDIAYYTIPINFVLSVLVAILHSKGDTKTPMWAFVIANGINMVFSWLFIMQMHLGIKGAPLAALIGQSYAFIYLFIQVMKVLNTNLWKFATGIRLDSKMLERITRVGLYAVLYSITRPLTGMLMFKIAAQSGKEAIAAFSIGGRLFSVLFIFLGGLEVAISILTGQGMGVNNMGKIDKIIKEGIKVATINILVLAIPYVVFAKYLILAFSNDPAVIAEGVLYLRIVYVGLLSFAFLTVYNAVFKGSGETKPPMIAAVAANWVFKLPLAYWLSNAGLHATGVWLAIAISVAAEGFIVIYYFRKGKWRTKKV